MRSGRQRLPSPGRRQMLRAVAAAGGGLTLAFVLPGAGEPALAQSTAAFAPNAFLRIGSDGKVTLFCNKSEMGQGVYTAFAMLIAEELEVDITRIAVEAAPNRGELYGHPTYRLQFTGGSMSVASEWDRLRRAAASARMMLIAAAAGAWGVEATQLRAGNGAVHHADGRRIAYGELAEKAARLEPPKDVPLKNHAAFRVLGKPARRIEAHAKATGTAEFGIDVRRPGMLVAVVARPPRFGAKVASFKAGKLSAIPGVRAVAELPSGIAVIASNFWAAKLGRDALEIEWDTAEAVTLDSSAQRARFAELAKTPGLPALRRGDAARAMAAAARTFEAQYDVPYLAHAPMEPLNCVVDLRGDRCEIWTGTQMQSTDTEAVAAITGLPPERVVIHTTLLGGGFGRRANPAADFLSEAVHVAKALARSTPAPVKVVWTREDDIRGGYYRPQWHSRIAAGLDAGGKPVAWRHTLVGQSIIEGTSFAAGLIKDGVDLTSVEGAATMPYDIADVAVDLHSPKIGVPVLWWRSVGHSHTAFVVESFIDELAKLAGRDPYEFRKALLTGHPGHRAVLDLAVQNSDWGKALPEGVGRGLAVHESFGSRVAQVAEVRVSGTTFRVTRVVCAVDCGFAVNPDGVRAQMESAIAFGLSAALHGAITFKDGQVEQGNFNDYPILRMTEMPRVDVHIVASTDPPSGVGEPGTPPIAPAVANALFAATGKRLRSLPLRLA